jgi:DNA-directed RNA polymerase sigma subunit (sigma70/sigma32)
MIARLARLTQLLAEKLGLAPSIAELAREVGIEEENVIELLWLAQRVRSLDDLLQEDTDTTLADMMPDRSHAEAKVVEHMWQDQVLATLSTEDRAIVNMRRDGYEIKEIAARLNIPTGTVTSRLNRDIPNRIRAVVQAQTHQEEAS